MDTHTPPRRFLRGEWTVSAKGRPFHNLALDKVHESIINLRLLHLEVGWPSRQDGVGDMCINTVGQ